VAAEAEGDLEEWPGAAMGADTPAREEATVPLAGWQPLDQLEGLSRLTPAPEADRLALQASRRQMPGGVGDPDHLDQLGFEMGEGEQHAPSITDPGTADGAGIAHMANRYVATP